MFRSAARAVVRVAAAPAAARAMHSLARPAASILRRPVAHSSIAAVRRPAVASATPSRSLSVQSISSDQALQSALESAKPGQLVVVDWSASWCGPCKAIAPIYNALAEATPNVLFLKVDIDELQDASVEAGVQSVPTFHFIKNSELVAEFSGADQNKLKQLVKQHA